ncbi:MAG: 3-dehydroquinate synthase [Nitrospirae bacterium]|nr:MAG: 3-dehydroquinate synthase [Nitrospirota bacterium]
MSSDSHKNQRGGAPLDRVRVDLPDHGYDILIQEGVIDRAGEALRALALGPHAVVVTNAVVKRLYGSRLARGLKAAGFKPAILCLPDGERTKSLKWVSAILDELVRRRYERTTVLLALGGGVTGDLAGFAASVYLRGIPFVQIPTTLVAQVDSSIGGKTGVNHRLGKNLIGSFYQPRLVLSDPGVIRTLPPREYRAGLAEVIKYGVIADPEFFKFLEGSMSRILELDPAAVQHIIRTSATVKAAIVSEDEREGDRRRILNFGHTLGHALETVTHYRRYKHGEAVAIGMVGAARLAAHLGLADAHIVGRIRDLVHGAGLPDGLPAYSATVLLRAMRQDKKVRDQRIHFVLPDRIGHVCVQPVDEPQIRRILPTRRPRT